MNPFYFHVSPDRLALILPCRTVRPIQASEFALQTLNSERSPKRHRVPAELPPGVLQCVGAE